MSPSNRAHVWRAVQETPYQVAYGALSAVYGLIAICTGADVTPTSLDDALPHWVVIVWCATLMIGGTVMLWGRLMSWPEIEAAGLSVQLGGILCYICGATLAMPVLGASVWFTIMSYTAIAFATVVRYMTVRQALKARRLAAKIKGG